MKMLSRIALRISMILACALFASQSYSALADDHPDFSQSELDQMLAPIALYPDTLLSQILIAATYPIEIVQADRWVRHHPDLKGSDAVNAAADQDWDPSVKSLLAFPDILSRMSDDIDWTQRLGDAFLADQDRVMDSVQHLRDKAYASGSLQRMDHLDVERDNGQIIIEQADPQVVYVPYYDPRYAYGNWWWPNYPPVYWYAPTSYGYGPGFYWGSSIFIGPTFFYTAFSWHDRHVIVIDRDEERHSHRDFYTPRSIVHFDGAREWHHDPDHRRGVIYRDADLRHQYGDRHPDHDQPRVFRDERGADPHGFDHRGQGPTQVYRDEHHDEHRDEHRDNQAHGQPQIIRTNDHDNRVPGRDPNHGSEQNIRGLEQHTNVNNFHQNSQPTQDVNRQPENRVNQNNATRNEQYGHSFERVQQDQRNDNRSALGRVQEQHNSQNRSALQQIQQNQSNNRVETPMRIERPMNQQPVMNRVNPPIERTENVRIPQPRAENRNENNGGRHEKNDRDKDKN